MKPILVTLSILAGIAATTEAYAQTPPTALCHDVVVQAGTACSADAVIDNGSSDPDGQIMSRVQTPPGPYPLGVTTVTLRVTDNDGLFSECTATVTVVDNTPPTIKCPEPLTVQVDTDSVAATDPLVAGFLAGATAVDSCHVPPAVTNDAPAYFTVGTTTVTFSTQDSSGRVATCTSTVTLIRNLPPDCSNLTVSFSNWPPNHRMEPVRISGVVDPDGDDVDVHAVSVSQNEAISSDDDDDASCPDAEIRDGTAYLRVERAGHGNGRVYAVHYLADDGKGGTCEGTVVVCVPHDQGHGNGNGNGNGNGHGPGRGGDDCAAADTLGLTLVDSFECTSTDSTDEDDPHLRVSHDNEREVTVTYQLRKAASIDLGVYNIAGRRIATLARETQSAGPHTAKWSATDARSGMYFYRLLTDGKAHGAKGVMLSRK